MFVNSPSTELRIVPDGAHFFSASHPQEVGEALISFVEKWQKG
jgi:hypothetical protein